MGLGKFGPALCAMLAAGLSEAICLRPSWKFKEEGRRKGRVGLWIWLVYIGSCPATTTITIERNRPKITPSFSVLCHFVGCGLPTRLVALPFIKILVVSLLEDLDVVDRRLGSASASDRRHSPRGV